MVAGHIVTEAHALVAATVHLGRALRRNAACDVLPDDGAAYAEELQSGWDSGDAQSVRGHGA
jgi:hypothetical protein